MHPDPTLPFLAQCPHDERLRSFAEAILPSDEMDAIQLHLTNCSECLVALDAYDDHSDTVVQVLSSLPCTSDDEREYVKLRQQLGENPIRLSPADCPTLTDEAEQRDAHSAFPSQVGGYQLLDLIGRGASGAVFRARHIQLDRIFAIKLLNSRHTLRDPQTIVRFQREVRAVGRLDHPNIVRATDAGEDSGRHFLVMEYVDGVDLSLLLRLNGPLRIADACALVRQAAIALQFAHEHKMVHRDVKPSNLFLTTEGNLKLLDLGLASLDESTESPEEADLPFGTGDYMPPEQWTNFRGVDGRADVYSLGCTLYKLLTGKPVFPTERRDYAAKMSAHCSNPVPNIRHLRPEVPLGLQKLIKKMLAKRADDRFETMEEIASRLANYSLEARLPSLAAEVADLPADPRESGGATRQADTEASNNSRRRLIRRLALGTIALSPIAILLAMRWKKHQPTLAADVWRSLTPASEIIRFPIGDKPTSGEQPSAAVFASTLPESNSETVRISAAGELALVELGNPVQGSFRLRADLKPESESIRAGFFLRYRPGRSREGLTYPFQAIEFVRGTSDAPRLCWGRYRFIEVADGNFEMDRFDWSSILLPNASNEQRNPTYQLDVTVGQTGLPQVRWDGRLIAPTAWQDELSFEGLHASKRTQTQLHSHYLGRIGLLVRDGVGSFSKMQLAYLD